MTRPRLTSTAVRDQIVAALHEAYPRALTTRELAERLAPVVVKVRCDCQVAACELPQVWSGECRILECHTTWHLARRRRKASDIHRHLLALSRSGDVVRLGHNRQASQAEPWTVEPDAAAIKEIAELEQAWTAS
ncbi:Uncharacterised protein [Mycobacteroides abscessus subsp. abscessus]|jgi:hypothetical protein|uniref:hypothetical protein n=1 Tax=Mycobacteroides abscessus TaxID=36809 RepID=UPI00092B2982|nr:hypothetical protein [Mycobacteroides abscessus]SIH22391.1 Uncharacterised protein [Mycobacteroides abscessus subsp. abscessus]